MTNLRNRLSCSSNLLNEQLRHTPIYTGVIAKLFKLLMSLGNLEHLGSDLLKVLCLTHNESRLAGTSINRGFHQRCSMSILGEHLGQHRERRGPLTLSAHKGTQSLEKQVVSRLQT
jgi:hypothetical protein